MANDKVRKYKFRRSFFGMSPDVLAFKVRVFTNDFKF